MSIGRGPKRTPGTRPKRNNRSTCSFSKRSVVSITVAVPEGVSSVRLRGGPTVVPAADVNCFSSPSATMHAPKPPCLPRHPGAVTLKLRPSAAGVTLIAAALSGVAQTGPLVASNASTSHPGIQWACVTAHLWASAAANASESYGRAGK